MSTFKDAFLNPEKYNKKKEKEAAEAQGPVATFGKFTYSKERYYDYLAQMNRRQQKQRNSPQTMQERRPVTGEAFKQWMQNGTGKVPTRDQREQLKTRVDRKNSVINAGLQGLGAQYTNLAGTAVGGAKEVNRAAYRSNNSQRYTAEKNSYDYWKKLADEAKSEEERKTYQQRADKAMANLKRMDEFLAFEEQPVEQAEQKLYEKADRLQERSAENTALAKEGTSKLGGLLVDAGINAVQMAGDAAANFVVPGSSLVALGARSFGGATQEARQGGATYGQQLVYGALNAGTEVLTEKMFDGLGKIYGTGFLDDTHTVKAIEGALGKLGQTAVGRAIVNTLSNMGEEAMEEVVAGILEPAYQSIYNGKSLGQNYTAETAQEILEAALVGGLLGGIGGAVDIANESRANKAAVDMYGSDTAALVNESLDINRNSQTAQRAKARMDAGQKVSGYDLRTMAAENEQINELRAKLDRGEALTKSEQRTLKQFGYAPETRVDPTTDYDAYFDDRSVWESAEAAEDTAETETPTAEAKPVTLWQPKRDISHEMAKAQYFAADNSMANEVLDDEATDLPDTAAGIMKSGYDSSQNPESYAKGWKIAYTYGNESVASKMGESMLQAAKASIAGKVLTESQLQNAFDAGRTAKQGQMEFRAKTGGGVTYNGGGKDLAKLKMHQLQKELNISKGQARQAWAVMQLGRIFHVNIDFYKSELVDGKYTGDNGQYIASTNTIRLDLNAGMNNATDSLMDVAMGRTMSHELVHWIKQNDLTGFGELRDYIHDQLGEERWKAALEAQHKKAANNGVKITDPVAIEEAVADASEMMLKDSNAIYTLARENMPLFEKIKSFVDQIVGRLQSAFGDGAKDEFAKELIDHYSEMQEIFDRALVDASHNVERSIAENVRDNASEAGYTEEVKKSSREWWYPRLTDQEWVTLKGIVNNQTFDESHYLDDMDSWGYKKEKGVEVFAIISRENPEDPTVLYAVGSKKAGALVSLIDEFKEGYNRNDIRAEVFDGWVKAGLAKRRAGARSNAGAGQRGQSVGNAGVSAASQTGNAGGNQGGGVQNNQSGVTGYGTFEEDGKLQNEIGEVTHPEEMKHSIRSYAQALDLDAVGDEFAWEIRDKRGNIVTSLTSQQVEKTPMGRMVDRAVKNGFITEAEAKTQYGFLRDLANMVIQHKDQAMVWEFVGSEVMSALKSNADAQYGTTVDFGTICKKTQAVIDAMSGTMMKLGRGLTIREVMTVYKETAKDQTVPCPFCYVFSRWMGVGGLLDRIDKFQRTYGSMNYEELQNALSGVNDSVAAYLAEHPDLPKSLQTTTGAPSNAKIIAKLRDNLLKQIESVQRDMTDLAYKGKTKSEAYKVLEATLDQLQEAVTPYEAYSWIKMTRLNKKGTGLNTKYKPVPNEVLFDMNKGAEFASQYPETWKYRTTRGAAMGKAIAPYSDARVGDIVMGIARDAKQNPDPKKNPFLNNKPAQNKSFATALYKMARQNLIGGQRYQSTSDVRYEYGLDYIMSFFDVQAIGGKVQMYTKVIEAVDFLCSVGVDLNLSAMPLGKGYNGNKLLFSDVTGINIDAASKMVGKYDNAQIIMVGISDEHIRLCLATDGKGQNPRIDFVIPYHASGGRGEIITEMMGTLGEKININQLQDYARVQNDIVLPNATAEQKARRTARMNIITGNVTDADLAAIESSEFLSDLYRRFYIDQSAEEYRNFLAKKQAEHIFPYEYWNKSLTYEQADQNGERFKQYCEELGMVPRFSGKELVNGKLNDTGFGDFTGDKGYWKTLIDRPMYNNDGTYHEQQRINMSGMEVTDGKVEPLDPAYGEKHWGKGGDIVPGAMSRAVDKSKTQGIVDRSVAEIESGVKRSARMTADEKADMDKRYMEAVNAGDMETAQQMVNEYASAMGYSDDNSWRMQHSAPNSHDADVTVNLRNLKGSDLVPKDYWEHPEGYTYSAEERESFYKVKKAVELAERKPGTKVGMWLYRAVSKTANSKEASFRNGDWVTPSKAYAENEGRMNPEGYRIISQWASIDNIYWDGNSIAEMGYDDGKSYAYADTKNNRKLLDPVTYDDDGKVIPLSKRFNKRNEDTRFSRRDYSNISDRDLLLNTVEGDTERENKMLPVYKENFRKMEKAVQRGDLKQAGVYQKVLQEMEQTSLKDLIPKQRNYVKQLLEDATLAGQMHQGAKDAAAQRRMTEAFEKRIADIRESNKAQRERMKDTETRGKMRKRIIKKVKALNEMLVNPSNTKHIPQGLQSTVAAFLDTFTDTNSVFRKERLEGLKAEYEKMAEGDSNLAGLYDVDIVDEIQELADTLGGGKRLSELSLEDTQRVANIVGHMAFIVKNENAIFIAGRQANLDEAAGEAIADARGDHKFRDLMNATTGIDGLDKVKDLGDKLLGVNNLKPTYFFDTMGGPWKRVWGDIMEGQNRYAFGMQGARAYFEDTMTKYDMWNWLKDKKARVEFTTEGGETVSLTRGEALSLFATWKREIRNAKQDAHHLQQGGFVYDTNSKVKGRKGTDTGIRLTMEDISKLESMLHDSKPNAEPFMDEMVRYLSEDMARMGNEASMQLYGYEKFGEDYYFPYKTSVDWRKAKIGDAGEQKNATNMAAIKDWGSSKNLKPQANSQVVVQDFLDVWSNHVTQMMTYSTMAAPQDAMARLFNYKSPASSDESQPSVKSALRAGYGNAYLAYIDTLMSDMNGGMVRDSRAGTVNSLVSLFKKGATGASMTVFLQQGSSVVRAWSMVDPKYFAKVSGHPFQSYQEAMQYSGIAALKDIGGFDTGTSRGGASWLINWEYDDPKNMKGVLEKVKRLATDPQTRDEAAYYLAGKADEYAWGRLWEAVKAETAAEHPGLSGEDLLKAAGQRFNDVAERTQVYDSVLTRSANMRAKDGLMVAATSFMAEPTTTANMLVSAAMHLNTAEGRKAFMRTTGSIVVATILGNAIKAMWAALRDDDKDESYLEKFLSKWLGNSKDDLIPWNLFPIGRDIQSMIEGYKVEASYASPFNDLIKGIKTLSNENASDWDKVQAILGGVGGITGVPLKNILRDLEAATRIPTIAQGGSTDIGVRNAIREGLGLDKITVTARIEDAYKAKSAESRDKALKDIQTIYQQKVQANLDKGKSKDEAEKSARTSVRSTMTKYLKAIYLSLPANERSSFMSFCYRITLGGKQVYDTKTIQGWKEER